MPFYIRLAALFLTLAILAPQPGIAEEKAEKPLDFQEVYDLLKSQLPEFDPTAMGDVAARSLIQNLRPRVQLLESEGATDDSDDSEPTIQPRLFKEAFGSLQLAEVTPEVAKAFPASYQALTETNRLKGLILDLRFAEGTDYKSATDLANLFIADEEPLADWGNGMIRSTPKSDAIELPTVVLINDETAGAPELLTAILRERNKVLVIGTRSAGEASMYHDFKLATGQRLRLATAPITLGKESKLDFQGVEPDIVVETDPAHERAWLEDPFLRMAGEQSDSTGASNAGTRRRLNEADLVRMLREGEVPEELQSPETTTPAAVTGPLIQDPVLARAIDFLKGLSLVRPFRAN